MCWLSSIVNISNHSVKLTRRSDVIRVLLCVVSAWKHLVRRSDSGYWKWPPRTARLRSASRVASQRSTTTVTLEQLDHPADSHSVKQAELPLASVRCGEMTDSATNCACKNITVLVISTFAGSYASLWASSLPVPNFQTPSEVKSYIRPWLFVSL